VVLKVQDQEDPPEIEMEEINEGDSDEELDHLNLD